MGAVWVNLRPTLAHLAVRVTCVSELFGGNDIEPSRTLWVCSCDQNTCPDGSRREMRIP